MLALVSCVDNGQAGAWPIKVVPPGRTFLHRLIDLSTTSTALDGTLSLTPDVQAEISWLHKFLPTLPGRSLIPDLEWTPSPDFPLFTDAAATDYGALFQGHSIADPSTRATLPDIERALSSRPCLPRLGSLVVAEEVARPLRQHGRRRHDGLGYLPRLPRNGALTQHLFGSKGGLCCLCAAYFWGG